MNNERMTATEIRQQQNQHYDRLGQLIDDEIKNLVGQGLTPEMASYCAMKVFEKAILDSTRGLRGDM